jgi:hypothetical protein
VFLYNWPALDLLYDDPHIVLKVIVTVMVKLFFHLELMLYVLQGNLDTDSVPLIFGQFVLGLLLGFDETTGKRSSSVSKDFLKIFEDNILVRYPLLFFEFG